MKYFLFLFFLITTRSVFSQTDSSQLSPQAVYLEIGGPGGYGSMNYEYGVFNKKRFTLALRAGLSTYHIRDYRNRLNPDFQIPLLLEAWYGTTHKLEAGFGQTVSAIVHATISENKAQRKFETSSVFSIGYRYQKNAGGFLFRVAYTPVLEFNRYLKNWAGISIGYVF